METAQGKANMITAAEVVVGDLIDDKNSDVRAAVAECGTDAQRQELINDEDERVRAAANDG